MVNIGNNFWLQIGYISLQTEIMLVDHSKLSNDHSKLKIDHSKVHIVLWNDCQQKFLLDFKNSLRSMVFWDSYPILHKEL